MSQILTFLGIRRVYFNTEEVIHVTQSSGSEKCMINAEMFRTCNTFFASCLYGIIWARRAHNKTVVASQGASTDSRFREEKLWLELSDGDENWHERWQGHGRRLEGLGFGIECAHCAQLRAKHAQRTLRAPFPCFLPYTAVKFGMNIQLGMADCWRVLVLGS